MHDSVFLANERFQPLFQVRECLEKNGDRNDQRCEGPAVRKEIENDRMQRHEPECEKFYVVLLKMGKRKPRCGVHRGE